MYNYTIPRTVRELQPASSAIVREARLYHTKNCQGATTRGFAITRCAELYHTKNCQGATTPEGEVAGDGLLYHTKNCQGATTSVVI